MKYYLAERQGWRLKIWPSDAEGPDGATVLDFILEPLEDSIEEDAGGSIDVTASELYAFVDWFTSWCPDPRKAAEREGGGG